MVQCIRCIVIEYTENEILKFQLASNARIMFYCDNMWLRVEVTREHLSSSEHFVVFHIYVYIFFQVSFLVLLPIAYRFLRMQCIRCIVSDCIENESLKFQRVMSELCFIVTICGYVLRYVRLYSLFCFVSKNCAELRLFISRSSCDSYWVRRVSQL